MSKTYQGINIDLSRDNNLSDQSSKLLLDYYCRDDEPSPQYAFARAAACYSFGDKKLAQRIYDAASKNWFMYASPVLSNAVLPKASGVGLEKYSSVNVKLSSLVLMYIPTLGNCHLPPTLNDDHRRSHQANCSLLISASSLIEHPPPTNWALNRGSVFFIQNVKLRWISGHIHCSALRVTTIIGAYNISHHISLNIAPHNLQSLSDKGRFANFVSHESQ